jgi:hypothetical protein
VKQKQREKYEIENYWFRYEKRIAAFKKLFRDILIVEVFKRFFGVETNKNI